MPNADVARLARLFLFCDALGYCLFCDVFDHAVEGNDALELRPLHIRTVNDRPGHVGAAEIGAAQIGPGQIGFRQIASERQASNKAARLRLVGHIRPVAPPLWSRSSTERSRAL